jgi:hypothetical protein
MTLWQTLIDKLPIKLLSLALAVALWLLATCSKVEYLDVSVPVAVRNPPPGLALAVAAPRRIDVTVAGPRIRLLGLHPERMSLELDLRNLGEGSVAFSGFEKRLRIPSGLTVTRINPSKLELRLVRVSRAGAGQCPAPRGIPEGAR